MSSSSSSSSSSSFSTSPSSSCHQFSLTEIRKATNNFDKKKVLGRGGEGFVYLAEICLHRKKIKTPVAVKQLKPNSSEFEKEIQTISKIQHPHLVSLLGYCKEPGQKILIYEYMQNGSLSDYVKKKISICLSWKQRLDICIGAARGLQHLHTPTDELPYGIIHRDIKPANILLDENWVAKVSDFGMFKLSQVGQSKSVMKTGLKGTCGYYAPEYLMHSQVTRKIDVYAFGVVLFEVLCRKKPWDRGDESYYAQDDEDLGVWAQENVDLEIKEQVTGDSLKVFTNIIGRSLQRDPSRRPTMDDVVLDLESALRCQVLEDEPLDSRSSSPSSDGGKQDQGRLAAESINRIALDEDYKSSLAKSIDIIVSDTSEALMESSIDVMKMLWGELTRAESGSNGRWINEISEYADILVSCLTTKVKKTLHFCMTGGSSRSCKHVLYTLMQIFLSQRLAHAVNECAIESLVTELLLWLENERIVRTQDDGDQLLKALNVLMLKILDNAERTSLFVILINLLRHGVNLSRWPSPPATDESLATRSKFFSDLVVKCLIKLTKVLESTIGDIDLDRLLLSIHLYLEELGMAEIRRRAGADDKPLRMVKTITHELVKLQGSAIKDHLSMVPIDKIPQSILLAYIDLNLQMLANANLLRA